MYIGNKKITEGNQKKYEEKVIRNVDLRRIKGRLYTRVESTIPRQEKIKIYTGKTHQHLE